MTLALGALLFFAAAGAGALNAVIGGGTFLSFPALVFAGVPAVTANATNALALVPGSLASAFAFRRELASSRRQLWWMSVASSAGGGVGGVLLLTTSERTFTALVPWLLLVASALFTAGPWLVARLPPARITSLLPLAAAQFAISVYGGYFGGGMGILMMGAWSLLGLTDVHAMAALRTWLAVLINATAVVAFVAAGRIAWAPGAVMICGATLGGYFGASLVRRLSPKTLRLVVVTLAWSMTAVFFVRR